MHIEYTYNRKNKRKPSLDDLVAFFAYEIVEGDLENIVSNRESQIGKKAPIANKSARVYDPICHDQNVTTFRVRASQQFISEVREWVKHG